jgi:hypothetical protein
VSSISAWAAIAVMKSKNTSIKIGLSFFIIIPPFDIIGRELLYCHRFKKKIGLPHGINLAVKYLNQYHSGEHQNLVNSRDAGSVIPDLIRDRHDEFFLFHCAFT